MGAMRVGMARLGTKAVATADAAVSERLCQSGFVRPPVRELCQFCARAVRVLRECCVSAV